MPKKVVITGATGFVGKYLSIYLLGKGIDIVPVSLRETLDPACFVNADSIIHLAGKAHDMKNETDTDAYFAINTELTKKVYDTFLQSNASVFIFMSSVKAVRDHAEGIVTEQTDPKPGTVYGISKRRAEEYIESKQPVVGKKYFILRPCMIHGPGNKGNLNLLYKFIENDIPYPLGAFQNRRSFLSVENLCFVINNIIRDNKFPSGIYNVADDEALSTNDLIIEINTCLRKKVKIWKISKSLIMVLARISDTLHLPFTTARLNKLTESYEVSNAKIIKALKINLPVSSRDGIRKTINSFKISQ